MKLIGHAAVDSRIWWGDTKIYLQKGREYCFAAAGEWQDAEIHCGAAGYDVSAVNPLARPLFKCFGWFRPLDTGVRWYMLLGRVGESGTIFEIGKECRYRVSEISTLHCTVNDVHLMYCNNKGSIGLDISET